MRLSSAELSVLSFTAIYLIAGLVASLRFGNLEFVVYVAVLVVLLAAVASLHFKIRLHIATLWGLAIWGAAHMAGGLLQVPETWPVAGEKPVLYNWWIVPKWLKFDQLVHAYGFGLVTLVCWHAIRHAFFVRGVRVTPTAGLLTLCVAGGMGFGAANEVVEFLATITVPETNVGGYRNTGWDLVANFIGALLAAAWIYARPGEVGRAPEIEGHGHAPS